MIAAFASQPRHHRHAMAFVLLAASSTTQPFCNSAGSISHLLARIVCHLAIWRRNCRNNDAAANFRQLDAAAWESNQLLLPLLVESS